ncbi:MAG TPA: hypothetical protein VJ965_12790 [Anaerolineales bacterium]|nr:hypothetical protein [Anaerolineales bacterium]
MRNNSQTEISETLALLREMVEDLRSEEVSLNSAAKTVADQLDPERWTYPYIKVLLGSNPPRPSEELQNAIQKLYRRKHAKARYTKGYWVKTSTVSEAEKDEWIQRIPMARRRELFRKEIQRLDRIKEKKSAG